MVKYQGLFKQPFILFPITFLLVFFLSFPWINAQNAIKPKPQEWQINGIVAALDDDYDEVKRYALSQLAQYQAQDLKAVLKQPEDIAEKAGEILRNKSVDSHIRSSAASALGNLGDTAEPYVKDILDLIKDEALESYIRDSAALALRNLGDAAKLYVKDIFYLTQDTTLDSYIRSSAVSALGNMGDAAKFYVKDIADILKDKSVDFNIRSSAAQALGNLRDAAKPYVKDIADILKDKSVDSIIRTSAALALGNLGDTATPYVKDIADILKDQSADSRVRSSAVYALGNMGDAAKPYIKEIFDLIKDKSVNSDVGYGAANALGNMGDAAKPYIKEILDLIKDESVDSNVRSSAVTALGNMGDAAKPYVKDIFDLTNDKSVDSHIRSVAVTALGNMGDAAKPYVKEIADILKDKSVDSWLRNNAVFALSNMGDAAKPYFQDILNIIKDKSADLHLRNSAARALINVQQLKLEEVVIVLDNVYYAGESFEDWRFSIYYLSGGTEEVKTLLKWTGYPKTLPKKLTHDEAVKTLKIFAKVWQSTQDLTRLRNDLARKIAVVAKKEFWEPQDIILLEQHYRNLKRAGYNEADTLKSVITDLKAWQWFSKFRNIILIHATFWLLLIFAYPKSPQIQAIFFWNPWVRRIFGMGYVGFLLAWIPFLRHKLFEPFQPSLLADAGLNSFDERVYFPESGVTETQITSSSKITPISQAIPHIQGEIVLEGDSGLGKSMFLRYLVKTSKRIIVYLPARKCEQGVIAAIQNKLHGQAQDAQFLKNLFIAAL